MKHQPAAQRAGRLALRMVPFLVLAAVAAYVLIAAPSSTQASSQPTHPSNTHKTRHEVAPGLQAIGPTISSSSGGDIGAEQKPARTNAAIKAPKSATATPAAGGAVPTIPHMLTPQACPQWISEYAAFHRKQRGQPGAKYLVYSACPGKSGLGDRMRGMMYLTRQAAATQRVVLFTWRNEPHQLQRYLPPAGPINWTLDGIQGYDFPDLKTFCDAAAGTDPKTLITNTTAATASSSNYNSSSSNTTTTTAAAAASGSVALRMTDYKSADKQLRAFVRNGGLQQLQHYRFITIHTNEYFAHPCSGCPDIADVGPVQDTARGGGAGVDVGAACLYRHLFGMSDDLQQAAQQQLESIYGNQATKPSFQFLAVHMRLGGMENEASLKSSKGGRNGPLLDLIHGITCIRSLGRQVGIDTRKVPVLLFTDHLELRSFVQQGLLVDVVTSAVIPTHIARMDKDEATDPQAALSTYVDVALLARARCAIYSRSGFSNTGWMMGGGQAGCAAHFTKGLEQCVADAAAEVAASTTTITKQSGKAARS